MRPTSGPGQVYRFTFSSTCGSRTQRWSYTRRSRATTGAAFFCLERWLASGACACILERHPIALRSFARQLSKKLREHPVDVIFATSSIPITLFECPQPIIFWTDAVFHTMNEYYAGAFTDLTSAAVRRSRWQEEEALRRCAIAAYSSTWAAERLRVSPTRRRFACSRLVPTTPSHYSAEQIASIAQKKRQRGAHSCELLFVGVDWERKGGNTAVETARLLNEAGIVTRLRVVGVKPAQTLPRFVECLGFIDKNSPDGLRRLTDLYFGADFFILPTRAEAAGLLFVKRIDSAFQSSPMPPADVPDYVRNDVNGVCLAPGSPASRFAESIAEILSTQGRYEKLSAGALQEFKTRLNWPNSVRILLELCHEALDKTRTQSSR